MKSNFVLKIAKAAFLIMFMLLPTILFAPPVPPPTGGTDPITPIDGGIMFLFIAGVSFGVYQIIQLKKKQFI